MLGRAETTYIIEESLSTVLSGMDFFKKEAQRDLGRIESTQSKKIDCRPQMRLGMAVLMIWFYMATIEVVTWEVDEQLVQLEYKTRVLSVQRPEIRGGTFFLI